MAENVIASLHNIYTLRGAPVRDPLRWSKYISEALYRFGLEAEVMFASHHWPRWGNQRIQEVLRGQRDLYAHMNNQVLHLANQGVTINEVHNVYELPKDLQEKWYCRGYHGSAQHNSRGVIQRYLGFWDCNPTTLIPLSPSDSAPLYVEMMGGAAYVRPEDRIATFDNDGNLWAEKPVYFQLLFAIDRVTELAPKHSEWKDKQPFKAAIEGDMKTLAASGEKGIAELVMASHAGMRPEEFQKIVGDRLAAAEHPRFGLILHHTDAEREYAYDRDSSVGRLDKALNDAPSKGWVVIDMKNDWKTVFPSEN
jgi:hypothetical protein